MQAVGLSSLLPSQWQHKAVLLDSNTWCALNCCSSFAPAPGSPECRCWAFHSNTLWSCWDWVRAALKLWVGSKKRNENRPPFMPHLLKRHLSQGDKIHLCSDRTAIFVFTFLNTITHFEPRINHLLQVKYFLSRRASWLVRVSLKLSLKIRQKLLWEISSL